MKILISILIVFYLKYCNCEIEESKNATTVSEKCLILCKLISNCEIKNGMCLFTFNSNKSMDIPKLRIKRKGGRGGGGFGGFGGGRGASVGRSGSFSGSSGSHGGGGGFILFFGGGSSHNSIGTANNERMSGFEIFLLILIFLFFVVMIYECATKKEENSKNANEFNPPDRYPPAPLHQQQPESPPICEEEIHRDFCKKNSSPPDQTSINIDERSKCIQQPTSSSPSCL